MALEYAWNLFQSVLIMFDNKYMFRDQKHERVSSCIYLFCSYFDIVTIYSLSVGTCCITILLQYWPNINVSLGQWDDKVHSMGLTYTDTVQINGRHLNIDYRIDSCNG